MSGSTVDKGKRVVDSGNAELIAAVDSGTLSSIGTGRTLRRRPFGGLKENGLKF